LALIGPAVFRKRDHAGEGSPLENHLEHAGVRPAAAAESQGVGLNGVSAKAEQSASADAGAVMYPPDTPEATSETRSDEAWEAFRRRQDAVSREFFAKAPSDREGTSLEAANRGEETPGMLRDGGLPVSKDKNY